MILFRQWETGAQPDFFGYVALDTLQTINNLTVSIIHKPTDTQRFTRIEVFNVASPLDPITPSSS